MTITHARLNRTTAQASVRNVKPTRISQTLGTASIPKRGFHLTYCCLKILLSFYFIITITGCVSYTPDNCGEEISFEQLQISEQNVISYWSSTVSVQQSKVFEDTYRLTRSDICGNTVTLYFEPNPNYRANSDPNSLSYPTGSKVRYFVNLKTNKVVEDYLVF